MDTCNSYRPLLSGSSVMIHWWTAKVKIIQRRIRQGAGY